MSDDLTITAYFDAKEAVHKVFGYVSDWKEIPMEDLRGHYWMLTDGEKNGSIVYCPDPFTEKAIEDGEVIYTAEIYTQRFLNKFVYRGKDHTMVCVDTHTDGNKFLMIFDADKECTDKKLIQVAKDTWA
jgi:hypothetical protein